MASTTTQAPSAVLKPKFFAQWMVIITVLGIAYFAVNRFVDAGRRILHIPAPPTSEAMAVHCAQFIALAKLNYGDSWKARLDPADTMCASEIQIAWEQQRRVPPPAAEALTLDSANTPPDSAPATNDDASVEAARARNPDTYCLNVVSLAKAKYGSEWQAKVSAEEAAACPQAVGAPSGQ